MKCPRTGTELKEIEIDGIKVDISEACGGVWFDNYELQKFDEAHEEAGEKLVQLMEKYRSDDIDLSARLHSPKHPEVVMVRRFYSAQRKIEIDECPMSGGIWLDAGELSKIRELFPLESDRRKAGEEFAKELTQTPEFQAMLEESEEARLKAERLGGMLRWISPRSYIKRKS